MKKITWFAAGAMAALVTCAQAQVFRGTVVDSTGTPGTASFRLKNAEDAARQLDDAALRRLLPSYVDTDAVRGDVDFRGVPMIGIFAVNSTTLNFSIPALGCSLTFNGATRTASVGLLIDALKKPTGCLKDLAKLLLARSPADPLAGNPNSLHSSMIASDFSVAFFSFDSLLDSDAPRPSRAARSILLAQAGGALPAVGQTAIGNLGGGAVTGASLDHDDVRANALTVPLQYNTRSDLDPRRGFSFRVPLTYATYSGSAAQHASFAFSYRFPAGDRWVITPAVAYGLVYSEDLAALGHIVSTSVTSSLGFKLPGFEMILGNMIGYYKSLEASSGDYSSDPQLSTVAFRNGLLFARGIDLGVFRSGQAYLIDTRTTGTELFMTSWQEIGVRLGTRTRINSARDYGSIGLGYLLSSQYKGVTVQATYLF